jgi:hypothetical protein
MLNAPKNRNYCAVVVKLDKFVELPNCSNVKAAVIFGNSVIVGKDVEPGAVGLFFPLETALSKEFLGANNLFRKPEWGNADPAKKGYFEEHGRIKAVKFRGNKSEGFWIPLDSLTEVINVSSPVTLPVGSEFDTINGVEICRKYEVKPGPQRSGGKQGRQPRIEDQIVEGQFRFHIDTDNLRRNIEKVQPSDWISISSKWHGTSAVFANVKVRRKLSLLERFLRFCGVRVQEDEYAVVWSSRRVVKGVGGVGRDQPHFYSTDVWGQVASEVQDLIPKGYTLYGEIVGYAGGKAIQKGYHYGCQTGSHRFLVYRITQTNDDGKVLELGWLQMKAFCAKVGLEMVQELFFGQARDYFSSVVPRWHEGFLKQLEEDFVHDQMCPENNLEVPAEGIVLKIERLDEAQSYKLKNYKFLEMESASLDKGEVDLEAEENTEAA